MQCTTPGCEGTDLVASTTAYLTIGPGPSPGPTDEPTPEIKGLACEEIELACRTCGQPVDDNADSTYDTAVRNLINELLRDLGLPLLQVTLHTPPRQPETAEPGSPAGPCADCGKPLFWNRTADRVHNKWGNYICSVTHRTHRTEDRA